MLLSMVTLLWMAGLGLIFAIFLPVWWLMLYDLSMVTYFGNWSIGFLRIGPNDLFVGLMVGGMVLRARRSEEWRLGKFPFLWLWGILLLMLCGSYLTAPVNQRNLTDPIRVVYQLSRYCARPVAYFVLASILLRSANRTYTAIYFIIGGAVQCSLMAIEQGYAGMAAAPGPFRTGNQLGGVLVIPMLMAMAGTIFPRNRFHWGFSFISLGLMARALLFCQSRGAMVACVGGGLVFGALLITRNIGRQRLKWMSPFIAMGLVAALPLLPLILANRFISHAVSAADGSKASTMQWRMQERWPHFWAIAVANPVFGIGTAVDLSLGPKANTPHNGFLSMLVMWGFPAFGILMFFAFRTIWNGCLLFWYAPNPDHKIHGLGVAAGVSGILTHQLVEVTLNAPFTFKVFWILVATTELAKRWPDDDTLGEPAIFKSHAELHRIEPHDPEFVAVRLTPRSSR